MNVAAPSLPGPLHQALERAVGADHVLVEPSLRAGYERDWTRRFGGPAAAVVRPSSVEEVAAVLIACAAAGVPVVPQGGNTGLVGGGVPRSGEVVLSLRRLATIRDLEPASRRLSVDAGVTLAAAAAAADAVGLAAAIDLASRDSATIGGMVATNAGGLHVLAYGRMGDQVLGIDTVAADGRVLRDAPIGDLVGSEGTLAVITAVRLRLLPRLEGQAIALVGYEGVGEALAAAGRIRSKLPSLVALELVLAGGLELTARHLGAALPFRPSPPAALVVECRGTGDPLDELAGALVGESDQVAVGTDGPSRRRLWALREAHAEAIATLGIPHKLDVYVPLPALEVFLGALEPAVRAVARGARTFVFGHVGVGNLHINVVGPADDSSAVDDAVLGLVVEHGGDVTGEHGAGSLKAGWLLRTRPAAELARIAARKEAYDPEGILNPGVIAAARILDT